MRPIIRIGTRQSALALWQAHHVADLLKEYYPGLEVEMVHFNTKGDKILEKSLAEIGGKGLFTAELEEAMHKGAIDIAVHSLKDMPTDLPQGLILGAITQREIPFDALVSPRYQTLDKLPQGAKVGTSSLRRQAQLLHARPDLDIYVLRGNVQTRLKKLETENFDAIVLAQAGLKRLELDHLITQVFTPETMLPAVGQGALAIECRQDDKEMLDLLALLNDQNTRYAVEAERAFLRSLNGGCQVPMGVYGTVKEGQLHLEALISSLDGAQVYQGHIDGPVEGAEAMGVDLADQLRKEGAQAIIDELLQEGVLQ